MLEGPWAREGPQRLRLKNPRSARLGTRLGTCSWSGAGVLLLPAPAASSQRTHAARCHDVLLQMGVDLRRSFNIAESTSALSHLGEQVIAISIIHRYIQWLRPQTILTSRLTEINGAARKQADPAAPLPVSPSRLHLFLFSAPPSICLPLHADINSNPPTNPPLPVVFICQDLFSSFCSPTFIRQPATSRKFFEVNLNAGAKLVRRSGGRTRAETSGFLSLVENIRGSGHSWHLNLNSFWFNRLKLFGVLLESEVLYM